MSGRSAARRGVKPQGNRRRGRSPDPGARAIHGFDYQFAWTLHMLVEFPDQTDWDVIQVEGTTEGADMTVLGGGGRAVLHVQVKERQDHRLWEPANLRSVLEKLAKCEGDSDTQYQFVYYGALGPVLHREIWPILDVLEHEGPAAVTQPDRALLEGELGSDATVFLLSHRFRIIRQESMDSVRLQVESRLHLLLERHRGTPVSRQEIAHLYDRVFGQIAQAAGRASRYSRRWSRAEVYHRLGIDSPAAHDRGLDVQRYIGWLRHDILGTQARMTFAPPQPELPSSARQVGPVGPERRTGLNLPVPATVPTEATLAACVLVGEPGIGKTSVLHQIAFDAMAAIEQARRGADKAEHRLPVLLDLAGYAGDGLPARIHSEFLAVGLTITEQEIETLARAGRLSLLIDNLDGVKRDHAGEVVRELQRWHRAHPGCQIIAATSMSSQAADLTWRTYVMPAVRPLDAQALLSVLPGMTANDARLILRHLPPELEHLATNRMTLRLLAYVYVRADRRIPQSYGLLYEDVVERLLAERRPRGHMSMEPDALKRLMALLARWMVEHGSVTVTVVELANLLASWARSTEGPTRAEFLQGHDLATVREDLLATGLLSVNQAGAVGFLHGSFRAYFAALAIQPADLAELLRDPRAESILPLWASLTTRSQSDQLVAMLGDRLLLLGRVVLARAHQRRQEEIDPADPAAYLNDLAGGLNGLLASFPVLARSGRLPALPGSLAACPAQGGDGWLLEWTEAEAPEPAGRCEIVPDLAGMPGGRSRASSWLLPRTVAAQYHPLELAYLWVLRLLADWTTYFRAPLRSLAGREVEIVRGPPNHRAVSHLLSTYTALQTLVDGLPEEIRQAMPVYATRAFHLAADVHEDEDRVHYALFASAGSRPNKLSAAILARQGADTPIFRLAVDGSYCSCDLGEGPQQVQGLQMTSISSLFERAPEWRALDLLSHHLADVLPGYPLFAW